MKQCNDEEERTPSQRFWFQNRTVISLTTLLLNPVDRLAYGVSHINRVKLRRARLVLGLVTFGGSIIQVFLFRLLSLAIPSWVGAMCSGNFWVKKWRGLSSV